MVGRFLKSGLLLPSVLTVLGLCVLVSLGNWQLARKSQKDRLASEIAQRQDAAPVVLSNVQDLRAWQARDGAEYTNVRLRGRFEHDLERHLYVAHKKLGPGYDVYTPLRVSETDVVWVNRGYVPQRLKTSRERAGIGAQDEVEVSGRVRFSGVAGAFTPENDAKNNIWYWRDLEGMHASAFKGSDVRALPFFVEVSASPSGANGFPRPGLSKVGLFNRHFEYALTWYGLALTLFGVYCAFAWDRWRQAQV